MTDGLTYRYERKFSAAGMGASGARHAVRSHPALFFEEYPPRWINNVYLDTLDLASVRDNADGIGERDKLRIRWYGELLGEVAQPVLEQKIKRGLVGRKSSHELAAFVFAHGMRGRELRERLHAAEIPATLAARLAPLRPVLVNRYWRHYYRSADRQFRLTVDSRMGFSSFPTSPGRRWLEPEADMILELKYGRDVEADASFVAGALPFRVSKSSKYVTGMLLTDPRVSA